MSDLEAEGKKMTKLIECAKTVWDLRVCEGDLEYDNCGSSSKQRQKLVVFSERRSKGCPFFNIIFILSRVLFCSFLKISSL